MTRLDALRELRDRVKDGMDGAATYKLCASAFYTPRVAVNAYDASAISDMNAALAFVEEALPGWGWSIDSEPSAVVYRPEPYYLVEAADSATPARALLLAALEALIEQESE